MTKQLFGTLMCVLVAAATPQLAFALDAVEMTYGATYKGSILGVDLKAGTLTIRTEEGLDKKLEWKDVVGIDRRSAPLPPPERYGDQLTDQERSEEGLSQMRLGVQIFGAAYVAGAVLCAVDCPTGNKAPYIPYIGGIIELVKEKFSLRGGAFAMTSAAQIIGTGIAINGYLMRQDAKRARAAPAKKAFLIQPIAAPDAYGALLTYRW